MNVDQRVTDARNGDKRALEEIVGAIQDKVFYLALRMLYNPEDAKDATQEIIIKVITNLSGFRGDSTFTTWVYRVATNYLLTTKSILKKDSALSFEAFRTDLEKDLQPPGTLETTTEYALLIEELRYSCTVAMLLCLDPRRRMAFILGEILELDHNEASTAMEISRENFRQLLSRARSAVVAFVGESCGVVNRNARCSCDKKLTGALNCHRVGTRQLPFSRQSPESRSEFTRRIENLATELKVLSMQRAVPVPARPLDYKVLVEDLLKRA